MKIEYNKNQWLTISKKYEKERETASNAYLVLDELILSYFKENCNDSIVLDYGAGSGTHARQIAPFVKEVIAYEPIDEMRKLLINQTPNTSYGNVKVVDDPKDIIKLREIDFINCSKVLDHIIDVPKTLSEFYSNLKNGGKLILTLAHPFKYSGKWEKDNGEYLYYKVDNYFNEGEITRSRENVKGKKFIDAVVCQHRTISTYFNWLIEAGFSVVRIEEPKPALSKADDLPILFDQASRIPNCIVFECLKHI